MPLRTVTRLQSSVSSLTTKTQSRAIVPRSTIITIRVHVVVVPIVSGRETHHTQLACTGTFVILTVVRTEEVLAPTDALTSVPKVKDVTTGGSMV